MDYRAALELARAAARLGSDDLETPTGCVVLDQEGNVAAVGWNRLPPGVERLRERRVRPGKYEWMIHAERHALVTARKSLRGHVMVLPWFPCSDCAARIRLAGIARLVCFVPDFGDPRWGLEFRRAEMELRAGGVELVFLEDDADRRALERAEALLDRLANEACGRCLYGLGVVCNCPTREDQVRWLADFAADEPRRRAEDARSPAEGPAYEAEVL